MTDRIFATANEWALASDGIQWMLMRRKTRRSGPYWQAVSFVRSTKDILARCMREKGTDERSARLLLSGLPDTFDQWKSLHSAAAATGNASPGLERSGAGGGCALGTRASPPAEGGHA
jgi:hypothetical protein